MDNSICLLLVCACLNLVPCVANETKSGRLLLILLDGLRHDYLNQSGLPLPGFAKMAEMGAKASGFVPEFPTLSFPNYYSILTGLHTESHGQTDNYMYDVTRNESFVSGTNPEHLNSHWWDQGDPIWATAERQNKRVYMYHWPSCNVEIRGVRPTKCLQYSAFPTFEQFNQSINESLDLFRSGKADVSAIYFELTDKIGHVYGPFSPELNLVLRDLDPIVSDLVDRLLGPDLADVNLMIVSDHGMTEISRERLIDISILLDPTDCCFALLNSYAIFQFYTKPGKDVEVYNKLRGFHPNMTVYLKSDLPENWYYKHGHYVAAVTAVADLGWMIIRPEGANLTTMYRGFHGYDPKYSDMQGIFLGVGPAFKKGARVDRLGTIDVYNAMCEILHITASPNNGTVAHVTPLLASSTVNAASSLASSMAVLVTLAFASSVTL